MDELVDWVQNAKAPGTVSFPVSTQTTGTPVSSISVAPFNPLAPAPRNNGLNSNYRYIGRHSEYRPGRELWCEHAGDQPGLPPPPIAGGQVSVKPSAAQASKTGR